MNEANDLQGRGMQPSPPAGELSLAASHLTLQLRIALVLLLTLVPLYMFGLPLHHDLAGSVLSGRLAVTLGEGFQDYSLYFPPAEQAWYSLAARLSDVLGIPLQLTIVAMSSLMVLFGAGLGYHIRCTTVGATPAFLIGSVATLIILPILFKNIFGLREHMVAAGLWPYLILRISDPEGTRIGWRLRALLGIWLGATLLFKYLYSVVVLLVELVDTLIQKRARLLFRIENIAAGGIVALYLFLWLGLDSSQRQAISAMFSSIDANLISPSESWSRIFDNSFFAVIMFALSRFFGLSMRTTLLCLAALAGAIIAAWSQERWYSHHLFLITCAYLFWWWLAGRHFRWWAHLMAALFLILPIIGEFWSIGNYRNQVAELDRAIAARKLSVTGKRVGILNMHPSPYNQYLLSRGAVRWIPMMNNAYVSAELQPFDKPENAGKLPPPVKLQNPGRRMLHEQMLRFWEDMPPDVLILDRSTNWPLRYVKVDWQHAFSNDPRFLAILARYRPVLSHDGPAVKFTYYVRIN